MLVRLLVLAFLAASILPGCSRKKGYDWDSSSPSQPSQPNQPWPPNNNQEDWRPQKWVWLGAVDVKHRTAQIERVYPGSVRGRFRQMRLTVSGGELEIYDVFVQLDNGAQFKPAMRENLGSGTRTRVLDLPGTVRGIREIRFHCRCVSKHERATISVFAR